MSAPARVPVVFVPGLAGHAGEFDQQISHLQGDRRRGIALDPFVDGDLTLAGRARRVVEAAYREGANRFVVVGHSASGMVALTIAVQQPERVAGVVLLDTPVLLPAPVRVVVRAPLALLRTALSRPLLRRFFEATFTANDPAAFRAAVLERLSATPSAAARALTRTTFLYDSGGALTSVSAPLLVVRANIPVRLDRLPAHVHRVDIPDVGHWAHVHATTRVNTALDDFLRVVDDADGLARGTAALDALGDGAG